jgi:hypothetical protein
MWSRSNDGTTEEFNRLLEEWLTKIQSISTFRPKEILHKKI